MTVKISLRQQVRQHALFACEYCGVTETDTGGELTIDHYHPQARGGTDDPENLIYCCLRCNLYKGDYWPLAETDVALWHPRREPFSEHFILLDDGYLHPLTATATATLERLHLNRPQLVAYRLKQQQQADLADLAAYYQAGLERVEQIILQQADIVGKQDTTLLNEVAWLRSLSRRRE